MKKLSNYRIPLVGLLTALAVVIGVSQLTTAAQKKEARVTQIIRQVHLLPSGASPRPASVNDLVATGTAVRTGTDSRSELTFPDQTLTRLGANSVFSFGDGGRNFDLSNGAMLICVPKEGGTTNVKVGAATAAVTGFTAMFEHHPKGISKVIVVHGHAKVSFTGFGPCVLNGGQMIVWPPHLTDCPPVLNVDILKLLKGKLISGFKNPLPELPILIADGNNQHDNPPPGGFTDPTNIDERDQGSNALPSPPPRVIGSPGL